MLTYERSPLESLPQNNSENFETLNMLETPYLVNNLSSSTDNSSRAINDTNHINVFYRNTMYAAYNDKNYTSLFSEESIEWMSRQITKRLEGVHPEGKNIIIPKNTILGIADSFYQGTQYTLGMLQEQVIGHIVEQVKNDYEMTIQNDKLSAWVQLYSMDTTLRQFNDYKLNEKRRTWFYNWNY